MSHKDDVPAKKEWRTPEVKTVHMVNCLHCENWGCGRCGRPPTTLAQLYADRNALRARVDELEAALTTISAIRDSIVGCQCWNWSEHAYPLVAVLDGVGFTGVGYQLATVNLGTVIDQRDAAAAEAKKFADRLASSESRFWDLVIWWENTEARAAEAHAIYQVEAHRRGDVRHADAYAELSEATKDWDRVLVRWVASTIRERAAK